MSAGIYALHDDGRVVELSEQPFSSEAKLQALLARIPNLLPGSQIDPDEPRRWLLISREVSIASEPQGAGRWWSDHLFVDQDAIPTFVEVKRSSDSRIRREVVGQLLDYAANAVVYCPVEKIQAAFVRTCELSESDPDQVLQKCLNDDSSSSDFWQKFKTNLQAGRIRLIFVADEIPPELRRIVEFLNEQMDPAEILAIEIRQYAGEGLTTLVPRVIGLTARAQQKTAVRLPQPWSKDAYFEELEAKHGLEQRKAAEQILEWASSRNLEIIWGQGTTMGSFVPVLSIGSKYHQLFAVYTYGTVEMYFQHYKKKAPFASEEKRRELLFRLNSIEGVTIAADRLDKRPPVPLSVLTDEKKLDSFLSIFDWVISEIRASHA
jgi:hypothetical protein